jgi:hypothetical protein
MPSASDLREKVGEQGASKADVAELTSRLGIGTIVLIAIIVLLILMLRRR